MLSNDQVLNKGRYRIVDSFGDNGFGVSYEAYDTISNTSVVLTETVGSRGKVTTFSQMEAINAAFLSGAKNLVEIKHDSIAGVQDYFADTDRHYLVTEPIDGFALSKYLQPYEPKPQLSELLSWADNLLDALHLLHTRPTPIVHGDIGPENIKITSNSAVKLLTSFARNDETSGIVSLAPALSSDDGGINYRPLEQLWDGLDSLSQRLILNHYDEASERWLLQPLNPATDLYALGATLYAVLTGTVPPDAIERSIAAIENKQDPLKPLSECDVSVPYEISEVIMKSMSLRREDRFYSAVILRQILLTATVRVKERESNVSGEIHIIPTAEPVLELLDIPLSVIEPHPTSSIPAATLLEIKAEEERLESERKELERRRLELDEKMQLQKAEEDRLNREAATAQQKLEVERLENERKDQEAIHARGLAAKILADKVNEFNTPLNEMVTTDTQPALPDDEVEILEISAFPHILERRRTEAVTTYQNSSVESISPPDVEQEQSGPSWRLPVFGVAAVAVLAACVGIWQFALSGPASTDQPIATQQMIAAPQPETVSPPPSESTIANQPAVEIQAPATAEQTHIKEAIKPNQTIAVQEKVKKQPVVQTAKAAPVKKAVTVDDLINDH